MYKPITKPFHHYLPTEKLEKKNAPDLSANIPKKLSVVSTYCTFVGRYTRRVILIAQSACQRSTGVAPDPHNGAWGGCKKECMKKRERQTP